MDRITRKQYEELIHERKNETERLNKEKEHALQFVKNQMDPSTQSNQSEMSMDPDIAHQNFVETVATKFYNAKMSELSDKNVSSPTYDMCDLLLIKQNMQKLFGNEIYERVLATYSKMHIQHSVDLQQNDNDIQIHVTI